MRRMIIFLLFLVLVFPLFSEGIYKAGFETGNKGWITAGKDTYLSLSGSEAYSGNFSLKITDRGPQKGQATGPFIKVEEGKYYKVSLWIKIDPDLADKVRVDLTLWDEGKKLVRKGKRVFSILIGETDLKGEWRELSRIFQVPKGVSYIRIRVLPAFSSPARFGSCWFDEVRIEEVKPRSYPIQTLWENPEFDS